MMTPPLLLMPLFVVVRGCCSACDLRLQRQPHTRCPIPASLSSSHDEQRMRVLMHGAKLGGSGWNAATSARKAGGCGGWWWWWGGTQIPPSPAWEKKDGQRTGTKRGPLWSPSKGG